MLFILFKIILLILISIMKYLSYYLLVLHLLQLSDLDLDGKLVKHAEKRQQTLANFAILQPFLLTFVTLFYFFPNYPYVIVFCF